MRRSLWSTSAGMVLAAAVLVAQGPAPATRVSPDTSCTSSDTVVTGELVIEPATLINLGFEWFIQGDANRNASVDVAFRKKGRRPLASGVAVAASAGRTDLCRVARRRGCAEHVRRKRARSGARHAV